MRYTFDLTVISIGIIEFFQFGINFDISCILIYILYICMLLIPRISISIGIYFSYIYMFYLCLLYPYIFKHKILFMLVLEL